MHNCCFLLVRFAIYMIITILISFSKGSLIELFVAAFHCYHFWFRETDETRRCTVAPPGERLSRTGSRKPPSSGGRPPVLHSPRRRRPSPVAARANPAPGPGGLCPAHRHASAAMRELGARRGSGSRGGAPRSVTSDGRRREVTSYRRDVTLMPR